MHQTNCRVFCILYSVPWAKIVWVGTMYNPRIPHYIAVNLSEQTRLWTGVGPLVTAFVSWPSSLTNEDILFWEILNPLWIGWNIYDPPDKLHDLPKYLHDPRHQITSIFHVIFAVPPYMSLLGPNFFWPEAYPAYASSSLASLLLHAVYMQL